MTAVVGILNKQAVAIAADSAVTIGGGINGRKIFNGANKVFTLSKQHPVGIMIYNAASFMGTPWETIIKVYRKQLDKKSFPTLKEYEQDFINFLRSKSFYTNAETQALFLENFIVTVIKSIATETVKTQKVVSSLIERKKEFLTLFEKQLDNYTVQWAAQSKCSEFEDYTFEMFEAYSNTIFEKVKQTQFTNNGITLTPDILSKIKRYSYAILQAQEILSSYTGLIFTGFGEDEIYPQLIPVNISLVVENRLRNFIDENNTASITNIKSGAVRNFAQRDVIDTILSGIDPGLDKIYLQNFDALFKKYNQAILDNIGNTNPLLTQQIKNLKTDIIVQEFHKMNQQIKKEKYINPLMNAVSSLAKEDLAEMAESLIYLTYLKRRITFAEESVGGPVDVAVISKGDGFIWIKRKHYFRPELNQHFFDNYFK